MEGGRVGEEREEGRGVGEMKEEWGEGGMGTVRDTHWDIDSDISFPRVYRPPINVPCT